MNDHLDWRQVKNSMVRIKTHVNMCMKLFEITDDGKKQKVLLALANYQASNDKSALHVAYNAAMRLFPDYRYHGKMYRGVTSRTPMKSKQEAYKYLNTIAKMGKAGQEIFSFTTDKHLVQNVMASKIQFEQTGVGLDLNNLLQDHLSSDTRSEIFSDEPEVHNWFSQQQEVLAPMYQNFKIFHFGE